MGEKTTTQNKYLQTTLAQNQTTKQKHWNNKQKQTKHNKVVQTSLPQGAHGQTSLKVLVFVLLLLLFCCAFVPHVLFVACWMFWARGVWTSYLFCFSMFVCCSHMMFVFSYVPFICGIGRDSPDPWARGEWWANPRQVQRDSQLAAGRCVSFRLRSAPLFCAALHCAALRFLLVYWLGLPWALGLSWVVG